MIRRPPRSTLDRSSAASDVYKRQALSRLPAPSTGDIFFDFEGDPLWQEPGSGIWGLEYLFGMIEVDSGEERFRAFWAHDRREEKQALVSFVDHVHALPLIPICRCRRARRGRSRRAPYR